MLVEFEAVLEQRTHGRGTYLMLFLDDMTSDFLADLPLPRGGFGSLRCTATIGASTWATSVFPSHDQFLLLVAKSVARREHLAVDAPVHVALEL
jgi:hypothetical protein